MNIDEQCKISIESVLRFIATIAVHIFTRTIMNVSCRVSYCLFNSQFDASANGQTSCATKALKYFARSFRAGGEGGGDGNGDGCPACRCSELASSRIYRHGEKRRAARCSLERRLQPRDRSACSSSRALFLSFLAIHRKIASRHSPQTRIQTRRRESYLINGR